MIANLLNYIVWDPDPILAHLGPMTIRYYSTCWMIGLLLGYLLMSKLYKQQGLSDEKFSPLFLYIFLGVLIGGRLGHCIFYQPEYFLTQWDHFIEMLIPVHHMPDGSWKFTGYEGLASHGGVFGMFVGIWLYCRNMKVSGWVVLDNMGICSGITATFIRLGNLMNSEIYGVHTDLPWGFIFVRDPLGDGLPHHPTQLYEALSYCILGLVLLWLYRTRLDRLRTGTIFGIFLIVLFGMRFLIEFIKEDQVAFEQGMTLNMGQWLSVPFIVAGILLLVWSFTKAGPAAIHVPESALKQPGQHPDRQTRKPKEKVPLDHVHSKNL